MAFEKGTDMVIKGVRVDGWWYCLNKLTQESNWVFQDYLKPKSEGEWYVQNIKHPNVIILNKVVY